MTGLKLSQGPVARWGLVFLNEMMVMAMETGHFYFISDDFYQKYDTDRKLMQNKESTDSKSHRRPCFFSFPDKNERNIYWLVPISSKIEKYRKIHDSKVEKQQKRGAVAPKCHTIRFGKVMGRDTAFLIQNMFPVTGAYIVSPYIDKNTGHEVTIDPNTEKDVISSAIEVLKLTKRGMGLLFADVSEIYEGLLAELNNESQHK